MQQDPAFVHTALLLSIALDDYVHRRPCGSRALFHLGAVIRLLNGQLSNSNRGIQDSTLVVVMALVQMNELLGDKFAATQHVTGLQQLVRLRGGLMALRYDTKIYMKLSR